MNQISQGERVVIVGAGIIGIACAHFLLSRAGFQVTLIDKGTVAGACSQSNCGYICPSHVLPLAQPSAIREALVSILNPRAAFRVKPRLSAVRDSLQRQANEIRRCASQGSTRLIYG
jgi:D-amino-acid dehydrogenase